MRILMLYSEHSKGVVDYTNHISQYVLPDQTIFKLPKLHVHDQESGKQVIQDILDCNDHDVLHIQYDNNMFATGHCAFEQLENFVWLVHTSINNGKRVVVTLHGVHQYTGAEDLLNKLQLKLLRRYWVRHVVPAWKQCEIIVHNFQHKRKLYELGCDTNVHIIEPDIIPHVTVSSSNEHDEVRVVVPGKRSGYKNYDQAFELLALLPENYHLHISDQGSVTDDTIAAQASRHKIIDRLHLVTFSSNKTDYLEQLKQYDVAVLPYTDDIPSSGSLQDCLSVMLPCLTTNTQSFREFNNRHACIIPCTCVVITGNLLIRRITQDAEYADKLINNIKEYHETNTPVKIKQQLHNVYTPVREIDDAKHNIINVFMCCRDNQDTLQHTFNKLATCEQSIPDMEFRYYILENDSQDDTPDIIRKFYETNNGNYSCLVFGNTKWASEPGVGRMRDMSRYRNMMKALCSEWNNSQYSFIIDSEIQFEADIMVKQIEYLQQNTDVAMVTPYGTVGTSDVYYDQFAYRDMNNTQDITNVKDRVRSAFAGFACIRTPVLQRCEWSCVDGDTSEHVPFCDMVRRHGAVAIDRGVKVRW